MKDTKEYTRPQLDDSTLEDGMFELADKIHEVLKIAKNQLN